MSFKKNKVFTAGLAFIVIICGVSYVNYSWEKKGEDEVVITLSKENEGNANKKNLNTIENELENQINLNDKKNEVVVVDVCGEVINPNNIYELKSGSRVADAVAAAGGCTQEADLSRINLAGIIKDGQKIYIPIVGEMKKQIDFFEDNNQIRGINEKNSLININTASKIELKELSGIGEVKATSIIEYRKEKDGFETIEDIIKVTGIGQATYEKIKAKIIVN